MKNYVLSFALAVLVVLAGASVKQSLASIGGSPAPPIPPSVTSIGGSPAPPIPPSMASIGGSPAPPIPPSGSAR